MTLDELAIKYGTDKSSLGHNYCPFYEKHLPKEPKRILEIGVKDGASMAMWTAYFPNAEIHGLDLFEEHTTESVIEFVDKACSAGQQMHLWRGHQCDWTILEELRKYNFDVIIDDGSHNARDQMMTFFGLFNGKHYFIEDLECARENFYSQGLPRLYRADLLFNDINLANEGTMYRNDISFDNDDYFKQSKIVCIHASELD